MSTVYLSEYLNNATFEIAERLPVAVAGAASWRDIQELCTFYRQRGVCSLLMSGDTRAFYLNMMQSASAFLHYLGICPDESKVTSNGKPFFDAMCGGYLDAAKQISAQSRVTWNPNAEYEEDFLYVRVLMLIAVDSEYREPATLLERMVAAAQGAEGTRIAVCRALLERDEPVFESALSSLLDTRIDTVEAMIARGALSGELASWLRHFASEGSALVRIGRVRGFALDDRFLHVPEAVRSVSPFEFDSTSWRDVEYRP
jgi:hypothetical protein